MHYIIIIFIYLNIQNVLKNNLFFKKTILIHYLVLNYIEDIIFIKFKIIIIIYFYKINLINSIYIFNQIYLIYYI